MGILSGSRVDNQNKTTKPIGLKPLSTQPLHRSLPPKTITNIQNIRILLTVIVNIAACLVLTPVPTIDRVLDVAGLRLKLAEFSLQFMHALCQYPSQFAMAYATWQEASLSECWFNLVTSSVIISSNFLNLPCMRLIFSLVLARSSG